MANDILTETTFWSIVLANRERKVVVCNPDLESRAKGWIEARMLSGTITVVANPQCPIDTAYVMPDPKVMLSRLMPDGSALFRP